MALFHDKLTVDSSAMIEMKLSVPNWARDSWYTHAYKHINIQYHNQIYQYAEYKYPIIAILDNIIITITPI